MTILRWTCPPERAAELMGPGAPFETVVDAAMGAQHEVFVRRQPHLRALLVAGAAQFGDRPYLVHDDGVVTFGDVERLVANASAVLRDGYGIGHGDRVAIASANRFEYVILAWAILSLGGVIVGLNGWWTTDELEYGIDLTEPKLLIGDAPRLARVRGRVGSLPRVDFDEVAGGWFDGDAVLPDVPIDEDDPFVVLFTSGTTGRSKGAVLTHRNNLHWIQSIALRTAARGVAPAESCEIAALPLFHIAGLNCQAISSVATGTKLVYLPESGRWNPSEQLRLTEQHGVTTWRLVPTQAWRLLESPDVDSYDVSSLRSIVGGGSIWSLQLLEQLAEKWPHARSGLIVGLGMTETNGTGTSALMPDLLTAPGNVGGPPPAGEVRVCTPGTDVEVADGEMGEMQIKSASVFVGYYGDDAATAAALGADRWYRTGDFCRVDSGRLLIEGRRSDLIVRGGENIYPREIEDRLHEHPEVADVVVVGRPDRVLGEEVAAIVVRHPGSSLDVDGVRQWVGATLAPFKVPVHVEFRDRLPRNATGKVMKHRLGDGSDVPHAED